MANTNAHLVLGKRGEDFAVSYLKGKAFKILVRNWRPDLALGQRANAHELDLVMQERFNKNLLIFVEVKTRNKASAQYFDLEASFTLAKQKKFVIAAKYYLESTKNWSKACRFDLIYIIEEADGSLELKHLKNVMEQKFNGATNSGGVMGSGNSSWQPW